MSDCTLANLPPMDTLTVLASYIFPMFACLVGGIIFGRTCG